MMQEGQKKMMNVSIRRFEKRDISNKVAWINDPQNNTYLHYNLPLDINKTEAWFEANKDRTDRYDAVIEVDGIPIGVIGLLSIDSGMAEYYVTLGNSAYKGKGVAAQATELLIEYGRKNFGLKMIEAFTEVQNISAQKLLERTGFIKQCLKKNSAVNRGKKVDRFYYILKLEGK